jgi:hypothetical protein
VKLAQSFPALPSGDQPQLPRSKRMLGLMLCTLSSVATLTLVVFLASQIVSFTQDDTLAKDIEELQNFSTAAGASD